MKNTALPFSRSIKRRIKIALIAVTMTTSPIYAYAEELSLDCEVTMQGVKTYSLHADIDSNGININNDDGTHSYKTNRTDGDHSEYFRITTTEIAWGSVDNILGSTIKIDATIDKRSVEYHSFGSLSYPKGAGNETVTETGICRKSDLPSRF